MLIAHGLLPDLVSQLSSYSFFGIAPLFWDQTEGQFKVKKSAITCTGSVITFQLALCLIGHDLYRQYQQNQMLGSSSTTTSANIEGDGDSSGHNVNGNSVEKAFNRLQRLSCALLLLTVAVFHGRNMRSAHALVAFFNGMIAFEQKYTGRIRLPTDWKGKLTKYFCLLVRLSNNIGPMLISILVVVSESNSPLNIVAFLTSPSGSTISPSYSSPELGDNNNGNGGNDLSSSSSTGSSSTSNSITNNQMVQKFITCTITAILNMIIWYMVVNTRGFWTCGQILIGCHGIRSALNLYESIMTRGKLLRITKEKIQEALIYREIQLLTNLFNEVHGNSIYVILLLSSSLLQTVSLYLYVRFITTMTTSYFLFTSWTWTSRLFIAYMVFDGIFITFVVFGCCAEVYMTSVQVKTHLQGNEVFQRSEWFTQFFLSCSTIKFKFGSTNFISEGEFGCGVSNSRSSCAIMTSAQTSSAAVDGMIMMTMMGNGASGAGVGVSQAAAANNSPKLANVVVNASIGGLEYNTTASLAFPTGLGEM